MIVPMRLTDRELLARLVAFDSRSASSNRPIADFVSGYAAALGLRVRQLPYQGGEKVNLLISRGPGDGPDGLLLSGHLDVVPADEGDWSSPPFELTERDGRFVGRGVADMKGFVALALNLLADAREAALRAPLQLLLTADEEIGSQGAQAFLRSWPGPLPRNVLVGEPTQLRVVRMHKGHLRLRVRVGGRPAHSGYPHLGENAIERAGEVIAAFAALAREWRGVRTDTSEYFPDCPYPVLNLGTIRGGSAVNIVPDACVLMVGVRLLPGQPTDWALTAIGACLATLHPATRAATATELDNDSPPLLCPPTAPLAERAGGLLGQAESIGVSYASDAGTLAQRGLECVLLGPGHIGDAHRANESLDIAQWRASRAHYAALIHEFCEQS